MKEDFSIPSLIISSQVQVKRYYILSFYLKKITRSFIAKYKRRDWNFESLNTLFINDNMHACDSRTNVVLFMH